MRYPLQYVPFTSVVDPAFWHLFTTKKLKVYKLDSSPIKITAFYSNGPLPPKCIFAYAQVDYQAFDEKWKPSGFYFPLYGYLINTNTLDEFKQLNKEDLLKSYGKEIWDSITTGAALDDPTLLSKFFLLSFADLKKYVYYYWFCFTMVRYPTVENVVEAKNLASFLTEKQVAELRDSYRAQRDFKTKAYFLIHVPVEGPVKIHPLRDYDLLTTGEVYLGFADPSTLFNYPGWVLRNFLALVAYHWGHKRTGWIVIGLRERFEDGIWHINDSLVIDIELFDFEHPEELPEFTGYELTNDRQLQPRRVNLSKTFDPKKLSEEAVSLNLNLMKWRVAPSLDLDKISSTKCLVLGAGTLGSNVARLLQSWSFKHITLVDNGQVSFSNPVRQSLYTFEDCSKEKRNKAELASAMLMAISPSTVAKGYAMTIPMPGHSVSEKIEDQVFKDVDLLEDLVKSHDVIFLLLDTREGRWLPTLLGALHKKLVINAALGFDSLLVQRHGIKLEQTSKFECASAVPIPGEHLGCYFCGDVVAPGDSMKDRTLDQQCTVTRPGSSYIASGLAVELAVTILQHPQQGLAPASVNQEETDSDSEQDHSPLGIIPHQIRGCLLNFSMAFLTSLAFDKCTACSPVVLKAYAADKKGFLRNVFNTPQFLEKLTGLDKLHESSVNAEIWEFSDDESITSSHSGAS